ncbi:MAG: VOC family protein [Ferruginibacter sp.]
MKRIFLLSIISISFSMNSFSQSKLGDVATVYITTANMDSSLVVYSKLGFTRSSYSDAPFRWSLLSDGSLNIMLRQDDKPFIGLTYYATDPHKLAEQLEKEGVVFDKKPKEGDVMKRYFIKSPDGFTITLVNNAGSFKQPTGITLLTMKPADFSAADKYPNKQAGAFGEFAQPVTDLNASVEFWKKLGFKVMANIKEPYPHAILSDGLMLIGLHQTSHFTYPAVTYFGMNTAKRVQDLKDNGLQNFSEIMGKNNVALQTWEGQHFFLFSLGM